MKIGTEKLSILSAFLVSWLAAGAGFAQQTLTVSPVQHQQHLRRGYHVEHFRPHERRKSLH